MRSVRMSAVIVVVLAGSLASVAFGQTFSVVYSFGSKGGDLFNPYLSGILAQGRDGNLYGTTAYGTLDSAGGVFKLSPAGTETVLYGFSFNSGYPNGSHAYGGLTLGI